MGKIYIAAGGGLAIVALIYSVFLAGAYQERARADAATNEARIEAIQQTKGARNDAANLDDDGLIDSLGRWLLPESP
jgi:hypothetical protein